MDSRTNAIVEAAAILLDKYADEATTSEAQVLRRAAASLRLNLPAAIDAAGGATGGALAERVRRLKREHAGDDRGHLCPGEMGRLCQCGTDALNADLESIARDLDRALAATPPGEAVAETVIESGADGQWLWQTFASRDASGEVRFTSDSAWGRHTIPISHAAFDKAVRALGYVPATPPTSLPDDVRWDVQWSAEPPTEPGWYWFRNEDNGTRVERVHRNHSDVLCSTFGTPIAGFIGEWTPCPPPTTNRIVDRLNRCGK